MLTTLVRTFRCQTMGQRLAEQGMCLSFFASPLEHSSHLSLTCGPG